MDTPNLDKLLSFERPFDSLPHAGRLELNALKDKNEKLQQHIRALLSCVQANGGRGGGGLVNPLFFSIKSVDDYAKVATKARDALG